MARLTVVDGPSPGTVYELGEVCLLGRALDCQVHIPDLTVSRRHAKITRVAEGFMVEDLGSGNGTWVNEKPVTRKILRDEDVIRVSGMRLQFADTPPNRWAHSADSVTMVGAVDHAPSIVKTVDAGRSMFDDAVRVTDPTEFTRMAQRLRTIYAVSEAIGSLLQLDELLPEILTRLFDVFPEAERAFIMLRDDKSGELVPKAVKRRRDTDSEEITVSSTILNQVLANRHAALSRDAMADARFLSGLSVANFGIRSMMCAPMLWRDETIGIIYLDSQTLGTFSKADLELLNGIAGQAALAVGNARLHSELLKRQRLEQDLQMAERIQQSFLPKRIPKVNGFTFAARYDPAFEVGGDFYDFVSLPGDRLGIVVGDVSGKGVAAALYMARMTRELRYFALAERDPGRVLQWMNKAVADIGQDDIFVTLVYVVLDKRRGELTIANAGHMPPVIRREVEDDVVVLDKVSGLPLGVLPEAEYESERYAMRPGDSVVLYSDGLVEAMSPSHEMFGMDRMVRSLARGSSEAAVLLDRALDTMQRHVGDAPQFDDTTVVVFGLDRRRGAAERSPPRP